jgi:hypothetical protein
MMDVAGKKALVTGANLPRPCWKRVHPRSMPVHVIRRRSATRGSRPFALT